jgi:hypothetical protein
MVTDTSSGLCDTDARLDATDWRELDRAAVVNHANINEHM